MVIDEHTRMIVFALLHRIDYKVEWEFEESSEDLTAYIMIDPPCKNVEFDLHTNGWLLIVYYGDNVKTIELPCVVTNIREISKTDTGTYVVKMTKDLFSVNRSSKS
ncbi:hypothetical protein DRP04_11430 [Archaeoglobales archaeon]|nr:MAG: hypothetical protein DRP04_11430 [Archaeoglobales archaeon]